MRIGVLLAIVGCAAFAGRLSGGSELRTAGAGSGSSAITTFKDIATQGPWSDVRAFGARGDGVADDTAPIRAAVEFARTRHSVVYFAPGAYRITKSLQLPPNVTLQGVGVGFGSALRPIDTDGITIHGKDYPGGYGFRNRIRGLTVVMTRAPASKGISIDAAYSVKLEDVLVFDAGTAGGIEIANAAHVSLDDVSVYGTWKGDGVVVRNSDVSAYDLDVEGVIDGMVVKNSQGVHLFGGHVERFGAYGVRFESSSFNSITGLRVFGSNNGTIGLGFLNSGRGPSSHNTIIASNLANPAADATAVFEDTPGQENTLLNCQLQGATVIRGRRQ
jgi:hypothetical protein